MGKKEVVSNRQYIEEFAVEALRIVLFLPDSPDTVSCLFFGVGEGL
jgi:hypothetical protein